MALLPTQEGYLPFRDYRIWYRITGSLHSPHLPLVVAHGGPGCTHDYVDSFRDIAAISGLVFKGFPGKPIKEKHLQSSSQLFFNVFNEYDSTNLLLLQAFEEVMDFQLEEARLRQALQRIHHQKIIVTEPDRPTPFAFPIMVDRNREKLSSEKLEDRIRRMMVRFEK